MQERRNIIPNQFSATIGRFWGALVSRKRSAYIAMLIKLIKPLTGLFDRILSIFSAPVGLPGQLPNTIMIISPPRSGSTIVFQTLARVFPGICLSNLHALFPRISSKFIRSRDGRIPLRHKNYYGYTASLFDVYEGNEYIDPLFTKMDDPDYTRMRFSDLLRLIRIKPEDVFIFKNVRSFNKVAQLSAAVPEVYFIWVRRDTEQVIQSVLRAYKELKSFHPVPDGLKNAAIDDPLEFAVRQILEIEGKIAEQLRQIDPSRWVEWEYEAFCDDPIGHITKLAGHLQMPVSSLRPERLTYELKASARKKVPEDDARRISELINVIKQD